jgi:hypothetical protein
LAANGLFRDAFIANDANDAVIHFNPVDDCLDISLAERDVAGSDVLAHGAAEALDGFGIESSRSDDLRLDAIEGGSREENA